MESFRISITPTRRAATRFISRVRRSLLKALMEEANISGLTQTDVAKTIGVHRSVVNRELRGMKDITLGRVAELAYSMGREIDFELVKPQLEIGRNAPGFFAVPVSAGKGSYTAKTAKNAPSATTKAVEMVPA
jgi:transcriptional regulator with XRE-family HTH domain